MNLKLGIVGLPNVGKSSLFNALTQHAIPAENYPFCTIDPNVGVVKVADSRLDTIVELVAPENVVPAVIEFVDIAGIVKGAHKGEGLGNDFLTNIRNVDAIIHVVRDFPDLGIIHVENRVDPKADKEIIELELVLKDLDSITKKIDKSKKDNSLGKLHDPFMQMLESLKSHLESGRLANSFESSDELLQLRRELFLLTDKPLIYLINGVWVSPEPEMIGKYRAELGLGDEDPVILLNIKQEVELLEFTGKEKSELMAEMGIVTTGIEELTRVGYRTLGLMSFFTAGPQEVRAWTVERGVTAPQAAGVIHTDFENKFISAEICGYNDFVDQGGWKGAREFGKVRLEGRDYVLQDGDLAIFRHGA